MPSLRARAFNFLLKHRHWLFLRASRPRIESTARVADLRRRGEWVARLSSRAPSGVEVTRVDEARVDEARVDEAAVRGEWVRARASDSRGVLLYLHGGCYVMGSAAARRGFVAGLARATGLDALSLDYRLAPESPFPAALDDAIAAYEWLQARGLSASRVVLAGDSAGGGLCLATLLALRDREIALPAAAVAISPWVDLTCASHGGIDPVVADGAWQVFGRAYAGPHALDEPLISPSFGDLTGLPPLHLSVGDDEVLLPEVQALATKASAAGVDVALRVEHGMVHTYPLFPRWIPEVSATVAEIVGFIGRHVARSETAS
ncbi:MAG: alpha/beta hydrolase [Acidobacteriota bacterium]